MRVSEGGEGKGREGREGKGRERKVREGKESKWGGDLKCKVMK